MNLATWSIRNPTPAVLLFLLLTVAGIIGFRNLGIQDFPDLDLPAVTVTLSQPGAAPAQLETEVARQVEDSMATLEGLEHISTSITDGVVVITAEFELGRPLSDALVDVKDAVDRVRDDLPTDLEEPLVSKVSVGPGGPILSYAIASSTMDEEALSWFTDDSVARAMLGVPGVGEFARVGGVSREVRVEVDPARLNALGITATDVSQALQQVQQEASGGRGQVGGSEQGLRTIATVRTAAELNALPIALSDGRFLRLDQVARVQDTVSEASQAARLDGAPAVGFQVSRSKGYDETEIAAGVERALQELQSRHPDLRVERVASSVEHTLDQYQGSMTMLWEGALLTVLVIWWYLRDWRATLIGALALPMSIIPTFAVMAALGYTLNTITLLALAVVVGILVDDAIVEVENIARHARPGRSVREATIEAVNEIAPAVISISFTLVVVFLPTALMAGIPGLIFQQFGWTVVASVIASLLVARLFTPVLAVWLVRPGQGEGQDSASMRAYLRLARWCLHHRFATMAAGTAFFLGSLALIPLLPTGAIPPADEGSTRIELELPPGSDLAATLASAEHARRVIVDVPGVKSVFTTVGEGQVSGGQGLSAGEVRTGSLTVVLTERGERPSQQEIENLIRPRLEEIPGARFALGSGGPGEKLQLVLAGTDSGLLEDTARKAERALRGLPFLANVSSTTSLERPEVTVRPDAVRAAERGVSTREIAETLRIATSGDFDAALSKLNLDSRQIPIRVQVPAQVRGDLQALAELRVHGRDGLVALGSVADLKLESGPAEISRYDRERQITISADLGGSALGDALAAVEALPEVRALPPGVRWVETGDAEIISDLFSGFIQAMLIGILCKLCILVLLYRDWFHPFTILSALPLAFGGAFVALIASREELGLPALIGLVMLLGIVTKNSILLVDFAVVGIRERGLSEVEALLDACHKRARPIMMTTVAMVAGMLPLALGFGGDASFRQPMAIAVIGGLITSTALSLLLVPVVFTFVSGIERRLLGHGITPRAEPVTLS